MTQPTTTSPEFHAKLHEALNQYFDDEELHTLCFDIGVDYDGLKGAGKAAKARELITYIEGHPEIFPPDKFNDSLAFVEPEQFPELTDCLLRKGYSEAAIRGILGGNFLRVAAAVWK